MDSTLPIVADIPSSAPGLGFNAYAQALAAAIRGGAPPQFTVGIYGAWGSGKSSLLRAIYTELGRDESITAVEFDAWRYERSDHILVPLLFKICSALQEEESGSEVVARLRAAVISVMRNLTFKVGPIALNSSDVTAESPAQRELRQIQELDGAFLKPYADMENIGRSLDGRRIVVLIDDLDRCSPANVVAVLEAINLVLDVPGFVFVLALDYDVLVRAVGERYPHASGHVFIEKMIQVPFRVPRLDLRPESFLKDLLSDGSDDLRELGQDFAETAYKVATLGLDANPRQIKRFINSALVLTRVAVLKHQEHDTRLLGAVIGLQLRWPAEYQDFHAAVFSDDARPTAALFDADDPALQRYAKEFFTPGQSSAQLLPVLQLTLSLAAAETVGYEAGDYAAGLLEPAEEVRERNHTLLMSALAQSGFEESDRYADAFYNRDHPGIRVKFGKTRARAEVRDESGRWKLVESFLLTRDSGRLGESLRDVSTFAAALKEAARQDKVPL